MALGLRGSFFRKQRMANQGPTPIPRDHTSMYHHAGVYTGWDCNLELKFEGNNKDTVVFLSI